MKQQVVAIRPVGTLPVPPEPAKAVAPNQKAIDALPFDSGTWRVQGVPGLYVRCRAATRSFYVQRRVKRNLIKRTLGEITLKDARAEAMRAWGLFKPAPAGGRKTFEQAFTEFTAQKELAAKTLEIYRYNLNRYLADWKARALEDIGRDRSAVRALYHQVAANHGKATGSQVIRMFSAVYNYARKVDIDLPESPTVAVTLPAIRSRDWAMPPAELRAWWAAVKTLNPVKRTWWLTCLLTGGRRASIEALEWPDLDFDKKTIRFRVTKGDRPYTVPMADRLAAILTAYRDGGEVPPGRWAFPSAAKPEGHLANVRDDKRHVTSAHHLRHTFRTTLVELGATSDQARLLMGHSMGGDVSRGYISGMAPMLIESLRPVTNAVADRYAAILEDLS